MSEDQLESRIEDLNDEHRAEFEERIAPIKSNLKETYFENHQEEIRNQIHHDEDELSDFNVVISGFLERDETAYSFIRTEPLIHQQKKNFDILLASLESRMAVLVEVERTLGDRLPGKVSDFKSQVELVEAGGDEEIDIESYFSTILPESPDEFDFVIASQHVPERQIRNEGTQQELNFIAWVLVSHGNTCRIYKYVVKNHEEAPFDGHQDESLGEYIDSVLAGGVTKHGYLNFTYSSSKYLKLKHMAVTIVNRIHRKGQDAFDYKDWKRLFGQEDVDLNNYLEVEKETLYRNFIEYGRACGVVALEEDNGEILTNGYRIKYADRSQENLVDKLEQQMTETRMEDDFKTELHEKKSELITELEQKQATGGTTLSDFINDEG